MAIGDTTQKIGKKLMDFLNIGERDLPAVRIIGPDGADVARYPLKGAITAERIVSFVDDFKDGKLKATYKS